MKLLPESPVELLEPLSRPPDTLFITEVGNRFGDAVIAGTERGIICLRLGESFQALASRLRSKWGTHIRVDSSHFQDIIARLERYFEGDPSPIRAVIQPVMTTPFTLKVHQFLTRIPFGTTLRYGDIARALGKPKASRAIGGACKRNHVLLIVPCHRVVASGGLGGFGAGLDLKKQLLDHEHILFPLHKG